jgi:sporulation protein YabP
MKLEMTIIQRKTAMIKGVREMEAFDDRRFSLSTVEGTVMVWGADLRLRKWEMEQGILMIEGEIDGVGYPLQRQELLEMTNEVVEPKGMFRAWKKWFE